MNKLVLNFALLAALSAGLSAHAQKKKEVINDSNTPLHLLQPDYQVGYGIVSAEDIKKDMDRVLRYLESNTPTRVVDKRNGKVITDYANMDTNVQLERGTFRLASYEWGVTYSAMLAAAEATGDEAYKKYVYDRFKFLSEVAPYFKKVYEKYGTTDAQMLQILTPHALDDAGAVCAAMMKAQMKDKSLKLQDMIDNYFHFIMYKEHRLADGTFARNRPYHNTLWLDDMFMGIPSVALMGRYASDHNDKYYQEAVRQILQFAERMFVPEKGLFRHGWVEGMKDHPAFHWGRANGWAILTMCEVLDVLPDDYPRRDKSFIRLSTGDVPTEGLFLLCVKCWMYFRPTIPDAIRLSTCCRHTFADWLPVKAKTVSGTSCSTAMTLTWNLLPLPSTYTVWHMPSIKDGLTPWHTVR